MRALLMMVAVVLGAGCFQLTGVSDYKVEEGCTVPAGAKCRVAPNCGCAANETCELVAADGRGECKPAGSVASGGFCKQNTECAVGLACLGGQCGAYCVKEPECSGGSCAPLEFGGTPVAGVGICTFPCDPLNASACAAGNACRITTTNSTACFANPGTGAPGAACTTDDNCAPTLFCNGTQCVAICVAGTTCGGGSACSDTVVTANGVGYGLCPVDG